MDMLKTLLVVALSAPPFLLVLTGCAFTPLPLPSPAPLTAAIFCNIEADRVCATQMDELMGVDIAKQYEAGFLANRSAQFGLDYSPAAIAVCGGPQKVLFRGPFPEGSTVCRNPKQFAIEGGVGHLPGIFPGTYSSVNQACKAWCDGQDWIDDDGNVYKCDHIAWRATGAESPILNACSEAGTPLPTVADLRKVRQKPVVWGDVFDVNVTGSTLTKTTNTLGWNAGAASTTSLSAGGEGYFEFTAAQTDTERVIGLAIGEPPDPDPSNADITYAVYLRRDGHLIVQENGLVKFTLATFGPGDRIRVGIIGGVVQYFINGELFYTSATPVSPISKYRISVSLGDPGATIADATTTF